MSDCFLGEIRLFPYGVVPRGWVTCNGQTLPIAQNVPLFNLLGVQFGGDGKTTFCLPDMCGRVGISQGTGTSVGPYTVGDAGGAETVTLTTDTIPAHGHPLNGASTSATTNSPKGAIPAQATGGALLYTANLGSIQPLAAQSIGPNGGGAAHENRQPFLALNFCISTMGIYPQRQ